MDTNIDIEAEKDKIEIEYSKSNLLSKEEVNVSENVVEYN